MRLALIGLTLGATLTGPAQAAAPTADEPFRLAVDPLIERVDVFAETEEYCLTLALYFEGGSTGESEQGQRHIARVIMERAKANRRIWGGNTICGVVHYKAKGTCQFSFACLPLARRTPRFGPAWRTSAEIARVALAGRNDGTHALIRYYMNAELTPLRNECRFRREFVPVGKAGRHEFFREATTLERRALTRTPFEACSKYEALLEAQKAKAEKAKAKKAAAKKGKSKQKLAKTKAKPGKAAARTRVAGRLKR
jgi:hypothetical protein